MPMGLIDTLTRAINPQQERPLARETTSKPEAGLPKSMVLGFGNLGVNKDKRTTAWQYTVTAQQRYTLRKRHPYIAAVHNAIVKQAKKVELEVCPIDPLEPFDENAKTRMEQFIKTGYGDYGEKEFRARLIDTKKWYGDAFAEIVFDNATGEPVIVNYLLAETLRVLPNEYGQVLGYPQIVDGALNHTFPPANIIHLKEHADEYSFFGYSDLDALFTSLLMDTLGDEQTVAYLENNATPSGIIDFGENVDDNDLARLRWETIIQLRQNPNKPVFLNKVKQWIPMGLTLKDMDWQELHRQVRERVMMVYGVLPMQVAVVETGRLANPEQQLEIGEEYIQQELEQVQAMYNLKLTPFFNNNANLEFRFKELEPKADAKQKAANILKTQAEAARTLSQVPGTYTKNELREITGHKKLLLGGDEYPEQPAPASPFGLAAHPETKAAAKPFAGYEDFDECVSQNQDQDDPQAYCASIMQDTEGRAGKQKSFERATKSKAEQRAKWENALLKSWSKFSKAAISRARKEYPATQTKAVQDKGLGELQTALATLGAILQQELESATRANATDTFKASKRALGFNLSQQDDRAIAQALSQGGALEAVKNFSAIQQKGFAEVFQAAFEDGLDLREMVKEMRNYSDAQDYALERVARTETNRFANQGRFAGYSELEDKRGEKYEYEWVITRDERLTERCEEIAAGNPYSLEDIMNVTDGGEPHINCRSNCVRVVK